MIIEKLSVTDFRVFQGKHEFDLSPRKKYGKSRPIILFGGLNGAGKTTTLTAIRLALYGKQSLGMMVAKKDYDEFLAKSIHRSRKSLLQANSAIIELSFSYGNQGVIKHYTVTRQWTVDKNKVTEGLIIAEDGKLLTELNHDQCQGFLNELIPIGVSDLFFFDAEKISELAQDSSGYALGDSIKKLLGLDIIETLDADLTILLRNENKKSASSDVRSEIESLESELTELESTAEVQLTNWEQSKIKISELSQNIARMENDLSSRGGAWAATREKALIELATLQSAKQQLEIQLRDVISGHYPLGIAPQLAKRALKQLSKEKEIHKRTAIASTIEKHISALKIKMSKTFDKKIAHTVNTAIDSELNSILSHDGNGELIHGLSERVQAAVEATIVDAADQQRDQAKQLASEIEKLEEKIDRAGVNIARAPEESSIKPLLEKITAEQERRAALMAEQNNLLEKYKATLRSAMEVARNLDKISQNSSADESSERTLRLASDAKTLLKRFSKEIAKRKVKDLEQEFVKSFNRLSRKDDIGLSAQIDPETFAVKLVGVDGQEVDKNEVLSAGEKQIYAISILEALARTSGRKLPIIIDTPLGRLDSKHRSNFINNYFPNASHQVIILSTDTEVDEAFYEDLSSSISHAYKLDYDSTTGSTSAKAGYFWKSTQVEIA